MNAKISHDEAIERQRQHKHHLEEIEILKLAEKRTKVGTKADVQNFINRVEWDIQERRRKEREYKYERETREIIETMVCIFKFDIFLHSLNLS